MNLSQEHQVLVERVTDWFRDMPRYCPPDAGAIQQEECMSRSCETCLALSLLRALGPDVVLRVVEEKQIRDFFSGVSSLGKSITYIPLLPPEPEVEK